MKKKLVLGERSILEKKHNIKRVKEYFRENPDATKAQCSRDLNLSSVTIWKHCKELFENSRGVNT